MYVRVFHDVEQDEQGRNLGFYGWQREHGMTLVFAYFEPDGQDDVELCERAFRLFNIGDDPAFGEPHPLALAYRRRRNRSLSVGDVVAIDNRYYHCADCGWEAVPPTTGPVPSSPIVVVNAPRWGTTPLAGE